MYVMSGRSAKQATSRAPRGSITRDAIIEAALAVVERGGADALTMRSVASEMGVKPMSLYSHVTGREDLLDAMYEVVLADIEFPVLTKGRWQDHVRVGATAFRDALHRRPALVPLVFARGGTGRAYLRATEHSLAMFRNAGFDAEHALHANRLVVVTIIGGLMSELLVQSLGPVAVPDGYPMMRESAPYLSAPDFNRAWDFALTSLIAGFEVQLRQSPARQSQGGD